MQRFRYKPLVSVFVFYLCISALGAQIKPAGHVSVLKKLSVIQTEYFDIIFPEDSAHSARRLASRADDLYRTAAAELNVTKKLHIPVLITRETQTFNAYFTAFPYNRIVLYDSAPPSSFSVFSDTLVSVFYHELVHALTLNIRSPFWQGLASVFGDILTPSFILNLPLSFTEGAAVSFESADGQGRLNDSYSLHVLRQAKLENKFPDWREITGAYGLYTDGSLPYIFGASFAAYLQKNYGMQKYAEFWKESGKLHAFKLSAGIFEKVYGTSLTQAWKDFENSLCVPLCALPPSSVFAPDHGEYRSGEKGAHIYANLTSSAKGLAWYDKSSASVMFLPVRTIGQRTVQNAKEFSPIVLCTSVLSDRLSFSHSGNFLVLSGLQGGTKAMHTVSVYDTRKERFVCEVQGLTEAVLAETGQGKHFLVGVERAGSAYALSLYDFDGLLTTASSAPPVKRVLLPHGVIPSESTDAGNGRIVCILKHADTAGKLVCSLFVYDIKNDTARIYAFAPENTQKDWNPSLRFPCTDNDILYLSCALTAQSPPVLAFLDLKSLDTDRPVLSVQHSGYSGGVFWPVAFEDGIAFVSRFYEHRRLSVVKDSFECYSLLLKSIFFEQSTDSIDYIDKLTRTCRIDAASEKSEDVGTDTNVFLPKTYRPLQYLKRGVLIPLAGFLTAASFGPYAPENTVLGMSAVTGDPAEHFLFAAGTGIDVETQNFNANTSFAFTEYPAGLAGSFYTEAGIKTGLKKAAVRLHTDFELPLVSGFSNVHAANTAYFLYNKDDTAYMKSGYALVNRLQLGFACSHKTGQGSFERIGFGANVQLFAKRNWSFPVAAQPLWLFSQVAETRFTFPFLLPFKNPRRFTLNLPFSCTATAYVNAAEQWGLKSRFILFAYDIQKALPFLPLFFRQLCLDGGVNATWYRNGKTDCIVHGSLFSVLTFNSGAAASYPVDVGVSVQWKPFENTTRNFKIMLKFSLFS